MVLAVYGKQNMMMMMIDWNNTTHVSESRKSVQIKLVIYLVIYLVQPHWQVSNQ